MTDQSNINNDLKKEMKQATTEKGCNGKVFLGRTNQTQRDINVKDNASRDNFSA
jgi:hypothetical protein